jgi:putative ABC transport system permease protein
MRYKGSGIVTSIETARTDLLQICRQLLKAPGFTITAVLLLAAGIAVSTAIFSVVLTVILRPLPYSNPNRLVQIASLSVKTGEQYNGTAPARDALDWKDMVPAFRDVAIYRFALLNMRSGNRAETLYGLSVTANLLPMLGVHPQLGQFFPPEDDQPGNGHFIILSDDLWRRQFAADPQIVGKTVQMNDEGYQVLGVMPRGFNFPLRLATTALLPTDQMQYWVPLGLDLSKEPHGASSSRVIARLRDGATIEQAKEQLARACRVLAMQYPTTNKDLTATLLSLRDQTILPVSGPLFALFVAAGLILLLTCANIATLSLARGESRAGELAVRMALGGSRWRIARLPIMQGVLLCGCGCFLGVPLAFVALRLLLRLAPIDVPRLTGAQIDFNAVVFAAALSLVNGALLGGLNSLQITRRSPREVLSDGARSSVGRPRTRLRASLVVVQVALAVVLVGGAGLMLRTFLNLLSTDVGYRADDVLYGVTVLPQSQYPRSEQRDLFFQRVLDRLRSTPGIELAAVSTGFPMVGQYDGAKVEAADLSPRDGSIGILADSNGVSSGYLEAMGVRLLRGRLLAETDMANSPKVAVIDESLAAALWPGENPLGKLINSNDPTQPIWRQVVGVVAPLHNKSLDVAARPALFLPLAQAGGYVNFVVIKTHAPSDEAARLLRKVVAGVDPNQGVFFTQSFAGLIGDTIAIRQFLFRVLVFFGVAALTLSTLGIYGLVSFIAVSRVREVGIRIALGATRGSIAGLIVSQGVRLTLIGSCIGILALPMLARILSGVLFGVRPFDIRTLLLSAFVLVAATILAALIPAWRSAKMQPMSALRAE